MSVKNCEGSEIFTLLTNNLAWHHGTDVGKRHENPGLKTKELTTQRNSSNQNVMILHQFPSLGSHMAVKRGPDDNCANNVFHYNRGTLSIGTLNILYCTVNMTTSFLRRRHYIFQHCLLYRQPW